MGLFEGGIIGELKKRKAKREVETFRDSFVAKLDGMGANEDALEIVSKINAESPEKLISAFNSISETISKNTLAGREAQIEDKIKQTLPIENFKARMSFIPELTKSMAESGKYSPEQIQEFAGFAAEKAQAGIANRINQATQQTPSGQVSLQATQAEDPSSAGDIYGSPLPEKKSMKEKERERKLDQGRNVIEGLRNKFIEIDDKYGVGRIQGQITGVRGALGDILPKGEQAPEVAVYNGLLDGASVFVGKNVWGDDRIAVDDRTAYKKSLARLSNTREEGELMFDALEEFAKSGDPKLQTALQLMIPHGGKGSGLSPSVALQEQGLLKIAVNKKTGEKMYQDRKTGKWRPLKKEKK